jgi:hypothetical protein
LNTSPAFLLYTASILVTALCLSQVVLRMIRDNHTSESSEGRRSVVSNPATWILVSVLVTYGLMVAGYFILRHNGQWAETDSASHTLAIRAIGESGSLIPQRGYYMHGIGYQTISLVLIVFTGLTVPILQTQVYPYIAAIAFILTTYVLFREITKNSITSVLATLLVLFQPEILFVTLRGSHEKFTWPLMILALTLFYRSVGQPLRKMIIYVVFFYLVVFTMISTNVFFGSVFLVAILLSMILGLVILRLIHVPRPPLPQADVQRLMYISLSGAILVFIFMAYVYPPALTNFRELRSILDQISALLLSFEVGAQPYAYISFGWVNPQVYLLLTTFTWILIATSIVEWFRRARKIWRGESRPGLVENIDWLLYTGFVIQIAISIMVDFSGALAANMQLRLFPGFTVIAIGMLARGIQEALSSKHWRGRLRLAAQTSAGIAAIWFSATAMLKATNEPLLSNKWGFYSTSEVSATRWVEANISNEIIWSGIDERIASQFRLYFLFDSKSGNFFYVGPFRPEGRYIFYSIYDQFREKRLGLSPLPIYAWDQIYDNGIVRLYHLTLYGEKSASP